MDFHWLAECHSFLNSLNQCPLFTDQLNPIIRMTIPNNCFGAIRERPRPNVLFLKAVSTFTSLYEKNIINIVIKILLSMGWGKELSQYLERIYLVGAVLLIGVVYLQEFISIDVLTTIKTVILMIVIFSSLALAKGTSFYVSIISLLLGNFLIFGYKMSGAVWLEGITKNLPMAIVLLMVPVLSIPVKEGGYLEAINYFLSKNAVNTRRLFSTLSVSIFGLSSIANLGAVRLIHDFVKGAKFSSRFLGKVYGVGFSGCVTWSPYFTSVNIVLYYTGVSFGDYFFWIYLWIGLIIYWQYAFGLIRKARMR